MAQLKAHLVTNSSLCTGSSVKLQSSY